MKKENKQNKRSIKSEVSVIIEEHQDENQWDDCSKTASEDPETLEKPKRKRGRIPNKNEDTKVRRLELNRQSAKESRKRKKQYMNNIENENKILV